MSEKMSENMSDKNSIVFAPLCNLLCCFAVFEQRSGVCHVCAAFKCRQSDQAKLLLRKQCEALRTFFPKSFTSGRQSTFWLYVSNVCLSSLVISSPVPCVAFHYFLVHYFSLLLTTMIEALNMRLQKGVRWGNDTEAQKMVGGDQ